MRIRTACLGSGPGLQNLGGPKILSEGLRLADSERGVGLIEKAQYTPSFKIETSSSFFAGSGNPILPPNSEAQVGSDSDRADGYYHWGALHALVAIAEEGAYPSPML